MPLSVKSSSYLAVHAPNGQYRPVFMPEGLDPATSIYQRVMRAIFKDFLAEKWFFVIIDNISFGADTLEELADRMIRVLERCKEANLTLKFEKSWHCQNTVKFSVMKLVMAIQEWMNRGFRLCLKSQCLPISQRCDIS
jgi:hypothetical protein